MGSTAEKAWTFSLRPLTTSRITAEGKGNLHGWSTVNSLMSTLITTAWRLTWMKTGRLIDGWILVLTAGKKNKRELEDPPAVKPIRHERFLRAEHSSSIRLPVVQRSAYERIIDQPPKEEESRKHWRREREDHLTIHHEKNRRETPGMVSVTVNHLFSTETPAILILSICLSLIG